MTAELRPPARQRPSVARRRPRRPFETWKWVTISVWALLVVWSIWGLDIKWSRLLDAPADLYRLFELMFTQLAWSDFGRCVRAMWDSIAMAWLGTLIAAVVAVPLGLLAAENLVPRWLSFLMRQLFNVLRAVPELILVLALIPVLGLTKTAGIVAIAIGSVGTLGKLCSEIDRGDRPRADRGRRCRRGLAAATPALGGVAPVDAGDRLVRPLPLRDQHPGVVGPRRARRRRHRTDPQRRPASSGSTGSPAWP